VLAVLAVMELDLVMEEDLVEHLLTQLDLLAEMVEMVRFQVVEVVAAGQLG
jgi:hypothetical protein